MISLKKEEKEGTFYIIFFKEGNKQNLITGENSKSVTWHRPEGQNGISYSAPPLLLKKSKRASEAGPP